MICPNATTTQISAGISASWATTSGSLIFFGCNTGKLYFKDARGQKLAFDFSSPVIRAAFITIAAYNPQLFTSSNGIESLEMMFIDHLGNVWGADATPTNQEYEL